ETARGESVRKDLIDDRAEVPVGAAARCDYEVVTVRHLVRCDAEPVQPRVADVAAREQPPIVHRWVGNGKRRTPPGFRVGLLVERRPDDERLPVTDVAER